MPPEGLDKSIITNLNNDCENQSPDVSSGELPQEKLILSEPEKTFVERLKNLESIVNEQQIWWVPT
jgi:hypothetical protein